MTALEVLKDREALESVFSRHGVKLAYLFGSQAEGKAGPLSDVDVAVWLSPTVNRKAWSDVQLDLMGELMALFERDDVDVVILNRADPVLAQQVAEHGRVLYEAMPGARVDFQVAALRRYVDTEPLRRMQDRCFFERVDQYRKLTEDA